MKKIYSIISLLVIALILSGCNDSSSKILDDTNDKDTNILIAFYDDESTAIEKTVSFIQEEVGGDLYSINEDQDDDFSTYEFIVLGCSTENNELPDEIEDF